MKSLIKAKSEVVLLKGLLTRVEREVTKLRALLIVAEGKETS